MKPPISYTSFVLPSRGALYEGRIPDGKVELRKLTVGEEIIIQSNSVGLDLIGKLIDNCVKLPLGFDSQQLLLGDRLALLIAMRVHTFGAKYAYSYPCRHCETSNKATVDLGVDIKPREIMPGQTEPITVTLPDAGVTVSLCFLRGKDETQVSRSARSLQMKSNDPNDPSLLTRMAIQLVAVDGEPIKTPAEKEEFVRFLTMPDAALWRQTIDDIEPGVDLGITAECRNCGGINEMALPFTADFFRPTRD